MNGTLLEYEKHLQGCRFCPMCKPAAEVASVTMLESHSTRARAMMLWRIAHGHAEWSPRSVELLYQSTLDSISEAWCVSHFPVSGYVLAARRAVLTSGLAPECVRRALAAGDGASAAPRSVDGATVLVGGEAAELGGAEALETARALLASLGLHVVPMVLRTGAVARALGDDERARSQGAALAEALSGAELLIADGPLTALALRLAPIDGAAVALLSEVLVERAQELETTLPPGTRVFLHDGRASAALADSLAGDQAIHPGFSGPEDVLGRGRVYEAPREVLDRVGLARVKTPWQRSLARSSGADDGLWLTYPRIAEALARRRMREAAAAGARHVVSDSLLAARWLAGVAAADGGPARVSWLPEVVRKAGAPRC